MRIYRVSMGVRILGCFSCMCIALLGVFLYLEPSKELILYILSICCLIIGVFGMGSFFLQTIELDDNEIKMAGGFYLLKEADSLVLANITKVTTGFVYLEEVSTFTLRGFDSQGEAKKIQFPIMSYPKEFICDLFNHLPSTTKFYLFANLKKRLIRIYPELETKFDVITA